MMTKEIICKKIFDKEILNKDYVIELLTMYGEWCFDAGKEHVKNNDSLEFKYKTYEDYAEDKINEEYINIKYTL